MSGNLSDPYNNSPPSDKDKNVIGLIFGEQAGRDCSNNPFTQFFWYCGLAIAITLVFWFFMSGYLTSQYNLGIKVVLFFIIVVLLDWLFTSWRETQPICK
jgi:hypothetical protein